MGAPKQKWTEDEEAALKAGVSKHGSGKWQAILKDPDFGHILSSRSNVDLKDKWRNINVTLSGLGSREKARLALKRNPHIPKHSRKPVALDSLAQGEAEASEARAFGLKPHAVSSFSDKLHVAASKRARGQPTILDDADVFVFKRRYLDSSLIHQLGTVDAFFSFASSQLYSLAALFQYRRPEQATLPLFSHQLPSRLESVILEAITILREPKGSEKHGIAAYIEERYGEPPSFTKLSLKLKSMASKGKLLKIRHRYIIPPNLTPFESRTSLSSDGKQEDIPKFEKNGTRIFSQPEVDPEVEKTRSMSADEAAATAARAVAEAEAAIADAAKAAMEAEAAEAEAEAAHIFAKAAFKACQKLCVR